MLRLQPPNTTTFPPNVPRTSAFLQFFSQQAGHAEEKPYVSKIPPPYSDQPQINFGGVYRQVVLTDIRGLENLFSLDESGFEFTNHAWSISGLVTGHDINGYIHEMSDWLLAYLGCSEVLVFDYTIRSEGRKPQGSVRHVDIARRVHCGRLPFLIMKIIVTQSAEPSLSALRSIASISYWKNSSTHGQSRGQAPPKSL